MTIIIPDQLIYKIRIGFMMLAIFCAALGTVYVMYQIAHQSSQYTTFSDQVATQSMQLKGQQYDNKKLQAQLASCQVALNKKAKIAPTPTEAVFVPEQPTIEPTVEPTVTQ